MALGQLFTAIVGGLIGGPAGAAVALGGSLAFGAYDARKARRQAEQNKRQRDLTITQPTAARRRVYGVDRVPGVLRYWTTHGAENRFVSLVYVFADHPCAAFVDIQFDDKSIGSLDGDGYVTSGPWYKTTRQANSRNLAAVAGSITLPVASAAMPSVALSGAYFPGYVPAVSTNDSGFVDLVPGVHFLHYVGGTTISLLGDLAGASIPEGALVVNWVTQTGRPLARVRRYLGAAPQTADATLITDSGGEWTAACRLDGQTYAIVTLEWDESVAANGVPVVHAVLQGALVYDPRTASTAWSDNWALCVRDFIKHASGCSDSEIDDATVIESADASDESVTVDDGTVSRYRLNGSVVIESPDDAIEALEDMALAAGGTISWSAGKFRVLAGMYRTPVSITLTDSDLAGGYQYQGEIPREDRFNSVIGAFRDARAVDGAQLYTRTDYSAYTNSAYVTEDGATIERRIDLDFVTDYRVANRIAKQIMRRARQGARITAAWKLKALLLQVGDVVTVSLARPGLVAKPFEVVSARYLFPNAVELVLQETDPTCYDWSATDAAFLDPAPNTLLPSPTDVAMPVLSVLCTADEPATIKTLSDGSQIPYARVSWLARTNAAEYVELRWKRSFETGYRLLRGRPGDTFIDIEGISGGDLLQIVGVAVNGIGARSDQWIIASFQVDSRLPRYTGAAPALSANLLKNAALEYVDGQLAVGAVGVSSDLVSIIKRTDAGYVIAGTPSSLLLQVADNTSTGTGNAGFVDWPPVSVDPTRDTRFVLSGYLIGWNTDAVMQVLWRDAGGTVIRTDSGDLVSGVPQESLARRWDRPDHYQRSGSFVTPPSSARSAVVRAVAGGTWIAGGTGKYVSIYQPFFGVVPDSANEYPPFDPGGQNVVDTPSIAPNATTLVISDTLSGARSIRADGNVDATALPSVTLPADLAVDDGATLRVHVSLSVSTTGGATVGLYQDIGMLFGLQDGLTGSVYPGAALFDSHLSAARDMAGVTLQGGGSYSWTFTHVAGVERRFALSVGFFVPVGGVDNSLWTSAVLPGSSLTVEVLKR